MLEAITEHGEAAGLTSSTDAYYLENSLEAPSKTTSPAAIGYDRSLSQAETLPADAAAAKPISAAVRRMSPGIAEHFASEESPVMKTARRLSTTVVDPTSQGDVPSARQPIRRLSSLVDEPLTSDTSSSPVMATARRMSISMVEYTPESDLAGPVLQTARRLSTISDPLCPPDPQSAATGGAYQLSLEAKRSTFKRQASDPIRFRRISPLAMGDIVSIDTPPSLHSPPITPSAGVGRQRVVRKVDLEAAACDQMELMDTTTTQMALQVKFWSCKLTFHLLSARLR